MTELEQREIFARNFRWYVDNSGKTQREIAQELGFSYTTVNTWYRGAALPNAAKIQTLADYFNVGKSALLDDHENKTREYYMDPETAALAQEMFDDPDMKVLYDMKRNMNPERFKAHVDFIKELYKQEHPDYDEGC